MPQSPSVLIPFGPFQIARAIRVAPTVPPAEALAALQLGYYRGVMVVHGGAAKMEEDLLDDVQHFAEDCLAPFAQAHRVIVVDGGTDSGVSLALGQARQRLSGTYALVGVLPYALALYPGGPPADGNRQPLNRDHTHFLLVEGEDFGAESDLMVGLLSECAAPGVVVVINGGEIVLREVQTHAERGHAIVTVRGSGRIADELADPDSAARRSLPPGARLHVLDIKAPAAGQSLLARLLFPDAPPSPSAPVG